MQSEIAKNFSIIIPVYNEAETIKNTVSGIIDTLEPQFSRNYEIILVNDCSTDKCEEILEQIHNSPDPTIVLHHPINKGYGASLKTGIRHSKYNWIIIMDGDGTYPVHSIPDLIKQSNNYDLITGHRQINGKGIPFERRWAKNFLNRFTSYLVSSKIPDLNCGLRMFKKDIVIKYWDLFPEKFSFTSTLTMVCLSHSYPTKFIPIEYYKRKGKSSIRAVDFINFLKLVTKLSLFFRPIKVFLPLSLLLLAVPLVLTVLFFLGIISTFYDTTILILFATALQTLFFGLLAEIVIYNK
ncbi:glycosyltransferase family 2 protein [Patescibacteria group bacterium]